MKLIRESQIYFTDLLSRAHSLKKEKTKILSIKDTAFNLTLCLNRIAYEIANRVIKAKNKNTIKNIRIVIFSGCCYFQFIDSTMYRQKYFIPPNGRSLNAAKAKPLLSDIALALLRLAIC